MARCAGQSRVKHFADKAHAFKPCGNIERRLLMLLHARRHGAQATQSEEHIIRANAETDIAMHALQLGEVIAFGRNSAEQGVGMADNIFGGRENGEINTEIEPKYREIRGISRMTGFLRRSCDATNGSAYCLCYS